MPNCWPRPSASVMRRHCAQLGVEASEELAPFKDRLSASAFEESHRAAVARLIRERYRLPVIAFD